MKPVIICGGVGSKMWPESRQKSPKHFLKLLGDKSLFQINYETLRKKFKPEEIFLQTNAVQAEIALAQEPEIPRDNVFIEPEMKNHGPATGLAAALLTKKGFGEEPFILVQTDLLRLPEDKWLAMIDECEKLVLRDNPLITGVEKPKFAVMGVDYLIKGDKIENTGDLEVYKMAQFLGRDTKEKVSEFVDSGSAYLHWNHMCAKPKTLLEAYRTYKPDWYQPLLNIVNGTEVAVEYGKMPKGPLEEVTKQAFVQNGYIIELPFECVDFGTWESVDKYLGEKNEQKIDGNEINIDANNNFIRVPKGKMVATIGLNDVVIIDSGDALLVMKKDQSGRVGEVVEKLKAEDRNELL